MKTNYRTTGMSRLRASLLRFRPGKGLGAGLLLACLALICACSKDSDNDDNDNAAPYTVEMVDDFPVWQMYWHYNQERPDWAEPDGSAFENWTIMVIQLEDELKPYVSGDDLMALFVNDELRGLCKPAVFVSDESMGSDMFVMKIYGNEASSETVKVSLKYYNATLKHIFTLNDEISLNYDLSTGAEDDYIAGFTLGSAKYPVVKTVTVEPILTHAGITPIGGNKVGVFVDEECRGLVTLSADGSTQMVVYGRKAGELVTLKYYDAISGLLFTIPDAVKL